MVVSKIEIPMMVLRESIQGFQRLYARGFYVKTSADYTGPKKGGRKSYWGTVKEYLTVKKLRKPQIKTCNKKLVSQHCAVDIS